jgi:hypothetical protein
VDALRTVEEEVRELIRRRQLDPAREDHLLRELVRDAVADYDQRSLLGGLAPLPDLAEATRSVMDAVAGFGPLQQYFDDPSVEEIWINEPTKVFVARGGLPELTSTILTADAVRDLVERMLKSSGRRVDLSSPFVDASLPDGSRLHVVIPDITRDHWHVNVRKFVVRADHLDDLVHLGTLTPLAADFLTAAVASGLNILVAGGTQAGKTTMLNCLAAAIPPHERVVTCEEVFELWVSSLYLMPAGDLRVDSSGRVTSPQFPCAPRKLSFSAQLVRLQWRVDARNIGRGRRSRWIALSADTISQSRPGRRICSSPGWHGRGVVHAVDVHTGCHRLLRAERRTEGGPPSQPRTSAGRDCAPAGLGHCGVVRRAGRAGR